MHSTTAALALAFWILNSLLLVDAGIFVVQPLRGSTCHGGQKCTVGWLDDGTNPLLPTVGVCTLGLFTGKQQLVQMIQPVDVSKTHSVTFTPNPGAGPNSGAYYISIISTSLKPNGSDPYAAFSPFFQIDQMTGSFDTPLASATAPISIPSALSSPSTASGTNPILTTITVGTLSTIFPPLPTGSSPKPTSTTQQSSTRLTTSIRPSSTPISPFTAVGSGVGSPAPATTSSSSAPSRTASLGRQVLALVSLISFALCWFL